MLENKFKQNLVRELKEKFPDCMVLHLDPNEIQGVPDILILNGSKWAEKKKKKSKDAQHRPNQDYYVKKMNEMSYASFIYPENKEEIINDLQRTFAPEGAARLPGCE